MNTSTLTSQHWEADSWASSSPRSSVKRSRFLTLRIRPRKQYRNSSGEVYFRRIGSVARVIHPGQANLVYTLTCTAFNNSLMLKRACTCVAWHWEKTFTKFTTCSNFKCSHKWRSTKKSRCFHHFVGVIVGVETHPVDTYELYRGYTTACFLKSWAEEADSDLSETRIAF